MIIHQGEEHALEFGVDALGTLVGDPLLFEEIEAIYFGAKLAAQISFKLYHYLKSKEELHGQSIEWIHRHESEDAELESVEDYDGNEKSWDNDYRNYREYDREVSGSSCQCVLS